MIPSFYSSCGRNESYYLSSRGAIFISDGAAAPEAKKMDRGSEALLPLDEVGRDNSEGSDMSINVQDEIE